jgi:hypothetical protein
MAVSLRSQIIALVSLLIVLIGSAFVLKRREFFLPGTTSDGHHVMERSCDSCHAPFAGVANDRCFSCHRAELADDIHPPGLFDDPHWAEDLTRIDALHCVTCHREHRVAPAGVTIGRDFCFACHDDVVKNRPSHRGLDPASCGDAGCHNYHDNSALNPSYLAAHLREPALLKNPGVPARAILARTAAVPSLDVPRGLATPAVMVAGWSASAHAAAGVTCASCHADSGRLVTRPGPAACRRCHDFEVDTFFAGKHGVRIQLGLPPLRPRDARLPMKLEAVSGPLHLDCATCHDPHSVNTRPAATTACLGCHDDGHSRSFQGSPHAKPPVPASLTCATCHLPRVKVRRDGKSRVAVNHNNSFTLRPRDRMAALVCTSCHGLEFSLTSIMNDRLVANNFAGRPQERLQTFEMMDIFVARGGGGERQ